MDYQQLVDLSPKLRSFTAAAYSVLAALDPALKPGQAVVYLAVHHHGDLMVHAAEGYRNTSASDVAQLVGLDPSTVARRLAALARRGLLARLPLGARRIGYRPLAEAESWLS